MTHFDPKRTDEGNNSSGGLSDWLRAGMLKSQRACGIRRQGVLDQFFNSLNQLKSLLRNLYSAPKLLRSTEC